MKKHLITSLTLGSAFAISGLSVSAEENPFSAQTMDSGYQQLAAHHKDGEGKCGEGKCGEATCGATKDAEASCGGDKGSEGKCGEGKCGEGTCGSTKDSEGSCGASKDNEGKCGEGKCGAA